jgi:hypothetical protein
VVREKLRVARRKRADHYRACGAPVAPRAARSTRTLGGMIRASLVLLLFAAGCRSACDVTEEKLTGDFERQAGTSQFVHLSLFWEDGNYIFNADTEEDDLIVGEWSFDQCVLELRYYVGHELKTQRFDVASFSDGILKLKDPDGGVEAVFSPWRRNEP